MPSSNEGYKRQSITASGVSAVFDVSRSNSATLFIDSGTFSGLNVTFEGSLNGVVWFGIQALRTNANTIEGTSGVLSAVPAYAWRIQTYGLQQIRARATALSSGTPNLKCMTSTAEIDPMPGVATSTVTCAGGAAHGAAISGNPVRLAARALNANYAAVSTGQTADLVSTLVGALIEKPYSIPEQDWSYAAAASGIASTTTAVTVKAAAGAGIRNYITSMDISTDTLGAATEFVIRDGAAGTVIWRGKLNTTALPLTTVVFPNPLKSTANTLLEVATLTSVTGGVYVNLRGYTAP